MPRLTVITLGVSDIRASIAFYGALGFARRLKATGEAVAFFDTGVFSGDAGLVVYVIGFWDVLAWLIVTFLAVVVTSLT